MQEAAKKVLEILKTLSIIVCMTLAESKNKIISYLVKNTEVSVLDASMIEKIGIGSNSEERDVASFVLAMESLVEIGLFKKQVVGNSSFWILVFKLGEQTQNVEVSYPVADAIAKTVEQYVKTNFDGSAKDAYSVDRTSLNEQDIAMLLYIISDLTTALQKQDEQESDR